MVNWRKKTRITEHMNTRMHIERKLGKRHVEGVDQSNVAANMAGNMAGNMAADMPANMTPESSMDRTFNPISSVKGWMGKIFLS